ncbi:MAG: hypothetical protein ABSH53_11860 [Holophaga sp.]
MHRPMPRLILLPLLATALLAQPAPPPQAGKAVQEGQILSQFYAMRVARIQESLGLPEDRARALAERWGRWDREMMDRGRQMFQLRSQFNQVLLGAGSEEDKNARVRPLVDKFMDLRRQQEDAKRKFETEILQTLTPAQQARMIILVEDIQGRIRETLREARRNGGRF